MHGAGGLYSPITGDVSINRETLHTRGGDPDTMVGVLRILRHEYGHHEQNVTMIREIADQLKIGKFDPHDEASIQQQVERVQAEIKRQTTLTSDAQPNGAIAKRILEKYGSRDGNEPSADLVKRILEFRDGMPLSAEQSTRAKTLIAAERDYVGLNGLNDVYKLQSDFSPLKYELERLQDPQSATAQSNVRYLMRNMLDDTGEPAPHTLQSLFGSEEAPAEIQALFEARKNGTVDYAQAADTFNRHIREHMNSINADMKAAFDEYFDSPLEREAYYIDSKFGLDFAGR